MNISPVAAAIAVLLAAWVAALAVRSERVQRLLVRSGLVTEPGSHSRVFYWLILLAGATGAGSVISDSVAAIAAILLPRIFIALATITAFVWLGRYCARSVLIWMTNEGIPFPWRWAAFVRLTVLLTGIALASELTGFAAPLLRNAYLILLAGGSLAAALAAVPLLKANLLHGHGQEPPKDELLH